MTLEGPQMRLTILGSGTCVPSLDRSSCAVLIRTGGRRLLIDCGPGTMRRLLRTGTTIFDLDYILLSHFHPDHSAEIVPLLFATKYPDGGRRRRPLTIVAGRGFQRFYDGLRAVYGSWIELAPGLLKIVELGTERQEQMAAGAFTLTSAPVVHGPESLAYRIDSPDGHSIVYSGDTDYSENLIELARAADILVCECATPDGMKVDGHLTPSLAGEIARRAKVAQLILTHFYPACEAVDLYAQCRRSYSGSLLLARDLLDVDPAAAGGRQPAADNRNRP